MLALPRINRFEPGNYQGTVYVIKETTREVIRMKETCRTIEVIDGDYVDIVEIEDDKEVLAWPIRT